MEERRKNARYTVPFLVELVLEGRAESPVRGESIDFSRDGIRVAFPLGRMSKKGRVLLNVQSDTERGTVPIAGSVRWVRSGAKRSELGIRFESIDSIDKSILLHQAQQASTYLDDPVGQTSD